MASLPSHYKHTRPLKFELELLTRRLKYRVSGERVPSRMCRKTVTLELDVRCEAISRIVYGFRKIITLTIEQLILLFILRLLFHL